MADATGDDNGNVRNETVIAYTVSDDPEEKDKFFRKTTKEKLSELVDALKEKYEQEKNNTTALRKENHNQHTEILNRDQQIITSPAEKVTQEDKQQAVEQEIVVLKRKLQVEKDAKKMAVNDLIAVKTKLVKKDDLAKDLMRRLDLMSQDDSWPNQDDPKLLIITDNYLENMLHELTFNGKISWDKLVLKNGVDNLSTILQDDDERKTVYRYEKVLLIVGFSDIMTGGDGFTTANKVSQAVPRLAELQVQISIVQLPPVTGNKSVDIDVFNMKIDSVSKEAQIIKTEHAFETIDMDEIVNIDGELKPAAFSLMAKAIAKQLKMPPKWEKEPYKFLDKPFMKRKLKTQKKLSEEPRHKPFEKSSMHSKSENSEDDEESIREILPILKKYTGLVIGNKGTNIRKIQEETDTKMQVIDWDEEKAVLIKGSDSAQIQCAKRKIEDLIMGSSEKKARGDIKYSNYENNKKI